MKTFLTKSNKIGLVLLGLVLLALGGVRVKGQVNNLDEAQLRANEIIAKYKEATGLAKIQNELNYLEMKFKFSWVTHGRTLSSLQNYSYNGANKIRLESMNVPNDAPFNILSIWNGERLYEKEVPYSDADRDVLLSQADQSKDKGLQDIKFRIFSRFFPITFDPLWYPATFKFRYIGTAKSPEGNMADVIETTYRGGNNAYQFLFDKKTHLLLAWITSWKDEKGKKNTSIRYFSDYKKASGLLVPHIIKSTGDNFPTTIKVLNFIALTVPKPERFEAPAKQK